MELDLKLISELLQALLLAVVPALGVYAVKLLQNYVTSALSKDQQYLLQLAIRTAVTAAEQLYSEELKAGVEKKEYAINTAIAWLEARGLKVDLQLIEAEIESAVFEYIN